MTSINNEEENTPAVSPDEWRYSRDRVLLYVRALDLSPYRGLELALESLRAAGPGSAGAAMRNLRHLLSEYGLDRGLLDEEGRHISSMPPLNRGVMVPQPLDRLPWKSSFVSFFRRWRRNLFGPWEKNGHE